VGELVYAATTGEFPNRAWPWIFVTLATALLVTWVPIMVCVVLVPWPSSTLALLANILLVVFPPTGGALFFAWLYAYRAPETLSITPLGISGAIRFSPSRRFTPRTVEIPFDMIRRVNFFFPAWAVRSKALTGGVWFIYLSRENARRVKGAWDRWKALSAPLTAGA
jgi:hypothetical protein